MTKVVGVRFRRAGKIYYFDPGKAKMAAGSHVIVETARGIEYGTVLIAPKEVDDKAVVQPLKPVIRVATPEDDKTEQRNKEKEKEAYKICFEKIAKHKLVMKLVDVEYTFNGSKVVFYFTADGRVDFRELVKDLASVFKTRIELRQIGVRDEAKMLGGLGSCGRPVCCKAFLSDFTPVSIKMAKEQNLSLSPTKISGICGRLMCCLKYEQDAYESMRKQMPRTGREVLTPDGSGTVLENNVITERTRVKVALNDGTFDVREYPFRELRVKNASSRPKLPDEEDTSVSTVEADALPLEAETALPSIAFGDDAPASELKKAPKKQQKRRAPTNGQKEPKETASPEAPESAEPAGDRQERPDGAPARRRGSRGGRRRNRANKPAEDRQQVQSQEESGSSSKE
mgnify:CR=1 FL=1